MEDNGAAPKGQSIRVNPLSESGKHQESRDERVNPWKLAMSKCFVCGSKFTIFRHRHMCGWCQFPACDRCSRGRKVLRAYHKPSRVCSLCIGKFCESKAQAHSDSYSQPVDDPRDPVPASLNIEDKNCLPVTTPSTAILSPPTSSSRERFFPDSEADTQQPGHQPTVDAQEVREDEAGVEAESGAEEFVYTGRSCKSQFDAMYIFVYMGLSIGILAAGAGYCIGYSVHRRR